jgi:AcrR family transcriptional regulator
VSKRRPYAARVPIEVRREQLLDAAIRVIVRDGYDGVSVEAIAREAGVTRPVVYGAFDGLGALLETLLDRQESRALAQLAAALPSEVDPAHLDRFVSESVRALVEGVRADPTTWRPILLGPHRAPEVVRRRIDADRERVRAQIADLVRLSLGSLGSSELDVDLAAHGVVGLLEHFGRLVLEEPEAYTADRFTDLIGDLVRLVHRRPSVQGRR